MVPDAYVTILEAPLDPYLTPDVGDAASEGAAAPFGDPTVDAGRLGAAESVPVPIVPYTRPIRLGSYGQDVQGAKRAIWRANGLGVPSGATKTFGPIAVSQLRKFQKARGLAVDGVLGPSTLRKLGPSFDRYAFLLYVGYPPGGSREQRARGAMVAYALWGYNSRALIHYAEYRPMTSLDELEKLPIAEDCSTFATKDYKYGAAPDPNGMSYDGYGNTSTMRAHGRVVALPDAKPGDLVHYDNPQHVAVYVGYGRVVSLGSDPGPSLAAYDYRPVREVRTYPLG